MTRILCSLIFSCALLIALPRSLLLAATFHDLLVEELVRQCALQAHACNEVRCHFGTKQNLLAASAIRQAFVAENARIEVLLDERERFFALLVDTARRNQEAVTALRAELHAAQTALADLRAALGGLRDAELWEFIAENAPAGAEVRANQTGSYS